MPPTSYTNLTRSEFWFQDGNIVLIAGPTAFKVHRGQLGRHSEIFNDLFSLPQPKNQELLEGCLCVELQDCQSDLLFFLRALYDGLYFQKPHANDFPIIAAVLRLSSKYLVEHLRLLCLNRLAIDWPMTLAGWDLRERAATDSSGHYMPREFCPHPILVINLALELGIYSILPAAFYDLSRYGPSKIMAGAEVPSPPVSPSPLASEQSVDAHSSSPPSPIPEPAPVQVRLSYDLLHRTYLGRESSQRYIAYFLATQLTDRTPSASCANVSRTCTDSFYYIHLNTLRSIGGISSGRDGDPLFTLTQAAEMLTRKDFSDGQKRCGLKICNGCKEDFQLSVKRAREEVWSLVPGWFGLGVAQEMRGESGHTGLCV